MCMQGRDESSDILTRMSVFKERRLVHSCCIYASVVKERRLTCAEAVRTTKYIADNRVNIFKQRVPRSVRWSLLFASERRRGCFGTRRSR